VLAFLLASIAPMTVSAGVIPTGFAVTGLTGVPFAFLAIAVVLAIFVPGYIAMSRRVRNAGAFYAFVAAGLGRTPGVAAALMALVGYESFQVASYGALGVTAASEATTYLHVTWPWPVWALAFWLVVTVLGLGKVEITGRVLAVLTAAEIIVVLIETVSGLARPAGGHVDYAALGPSTWTSLGAVGVVVVIAMTGFTGIEQSPVLAEEARNPRRTIRVATVTALAMIAVLYCGAAWAMVVHAGPAHVAGAAASQASQGGSLLYTLSPSPTIASIAQLLFITSLFAAALSYHNVTWRYLFSLSREGVLPAQLSRTGKAGIPRTASLAQSASGLIVIIVFAAARWPAMSGLFFGGGATGGLGVMILLAITSAAVIRYFRRQPRRLGDESTWVRAVAPAIACVLLTIGVVLAVWHYGTLLGTRPGNPASWLLPASYGAAALGGLAWGTRLKHRHPDVYNRIGRGHTTTAEPPAAEGVRS
jgi:amino acid transporter